MSFASRPDAYSLAAALLLQLIRISLLMVSYRMASDHQLTFPSIVYTRTHPCVPAPFAKFCIWVFPSPSVDIIHQSTLSIFSMGSCYLCLTLLTTHFWPVPRWCLARRAMMNKIAPMPIKIGLFYFWGVLNLSSVRKLGVSMLYALSRSNRLCAKFKIYWLYRPDMTV